MFSANVLNGGGCRLRFANASSISNKSKSFSEIVQCSGSLLSFIVDGMFSRKSEVRLLVICRCRRLHASNNGQRRFLHLRSMEKTSTIVQRRERRSSINSRFCPKGKWRETKIASIPSKIETKVLWGTNAKKAIRRSALLSFRQEICRVRGNLFSQENFLSTEQINNRTKESKSLLFSQKTFVNLSLLGKIFVLIDANRTIGNERCRSSLNRKKIARLPSARPDGHQVKTKAFRPRTTRSFHHLSSFRWWRFAVWHLREGFLWAWKSLFESSTKTAGPFYLRISLCSFTISTEWKALFSSSTL